MFLYNLLPHPNAESLLPNPVNDFQTQITINTMQLSIQSQFIDAQKL